MAEAGAKLLGRQDFAALSSASGGAEAKLGNRGSGLGLGV